MNASRITLFVKNFPFETTEAELRDVFASYGTVLDCRVLLLNGKAKGFAFVEMQREEGEKALEVNGAIWNGRELRVSESQDRPRKGAAA